MKRRHLFIPFIFTVAYVLSLGGRRRPKNMDRLDGWLYAHRGFHREPDAPENSLEAFRLAAEKGYGAELDVHLLADGNLAVLHDSRLKRMTGKGGVVESLTVSELSQYVLGNSRQTIPTLQQVLEVVDGRVPLIIELKPYKKNFRPLCERVFRDLDRYKGVYCVESFYPQVLMWLKKNRPDVIRGQLSMNYFKDHEGLSPLKAAGASSLFSNLLTRPDFIAYKYKDRGFLSNRICLKVWKLQGACWTLHSKEELKKVQAEDCWPIFENFDPETGKRFTGATDT